MNQRIAPKSAHPATQEAHRRARGWVDALDSTDFDEARRGFVGAPDSLEIRHDDGRHCWSLRPYAFLDQCEQAPATVHPSLWRHARLNNIHGLFKVAEGVYQIRGFDIANMAIIEGATGLIVLDTLTTTSQARAAMELYFAHRPRKPVRAVIYSHNHNDHYGGVKGIVSEQDLASGKVSIIGPAGFIEGIQSSLAFGNAMRRRIQYHYASFLQPGERSRIDIGLGKEGPITSNAVSLISPTDEITLSTEGRTIDGVEIEFLMTPDSEASASMMLYLPATRMLFAAELANHTLHNIYTPRGIPIRNVHGIAGGIGAALARYGENLDGVFLCHHWPKWGNARVRSFLEKQRDMYQYIHDQSVRLMNRGVTLKEIGEELALPPSLASESFCRGYYGTVNHNAKGIYQSYLGWFDGNPANLDPLPPREAALRYVEFMGGVDALLTRARECFERGEFRWVAEVVNHAVFANPGNGPARQLQADALEQLGYQSESSVWRNFYLAAADELRHGVAASPGSPAIVSDAMVQVFSPELYFKHLATRIDGPRASELTLTIDWRLTDTGQRYALTLSNGVLRCEGGKQSTLANATLSLDRSTFNALVSGKLGYDEAIAAERVRIEGEAQALQRLLGLLDPLDSSFPIVTP